MKRTILTGLVIVALVSTLVLTAGLAVANAQAQSSPQLYTVLVGWDNMANGSMLNAFFPAALKIHKGDTVKWLLNSMEFHTVTFLGGAPMPPFVVPAPANSLGSPVMANPAVAFPTIPAGGLYNGVGYVNSGLLAQGPGQTQQFALTFTNTGTFTYVCVIHGTTMSGTIVVVDSSVSVPSPAQASAQGFRELARLKATVPDVINKARDSVPEPVENADGTKTFFVNVGYAQGQVDLTAFFPKRLVVRPGDTVQWSLSKANVAPHTVTFLNGAAPQEVVVPLIVGGPPPLLLLNPAVLFPSNLGQPLTRSGVFNSGFMDPTQPGPHTYSLKIGNISGVIDYLCLLHDESGMVGSLVVLPRDK